MLDIFKVMKYSKTSYQQCVHLNGAKIMVSMTAAEKLSGKYWKGQVPIWLN